MEGKRRERWGTVSRGTAAVGAGVGGNMDGETRSSYSREDKPAVF